MGRRPVEALRQAFERAGPAIDDIDPVGIGPFTAGRDQDLSTRHFPCHDGGQDA
ncbi:hypothetical protein [Kitasatospora kazusensis]|uniref:hypothetical protein n=1 Tax=Kitasatospora kazusensis TaxID=407974 RepID=UPI0031E409C3